jgi:hypothetical protein
MKHDNDPPCYYEAKAWAEEQESGDAVAAYLLAFFIVVGIVGWIFY